MVVSYQISEAFKILVGDLDSLRNKLVSFDLWKNQYSAIKVDKLKKTIVPPVGKIAPTHFCHLKIKPKQRYYVEGIPFKYVLPLGLTEI